MGAVCLGAAVHSAIKVKVPLTTHRPNRKKTYWQIPWSCIGRPLIITLNILDPHVVTLLAETIEVNL